MKKGFFTLTFIFSIICITQGQKLTLLYPIGLTNGEIKIVDTLDALIEKGDKYVLTPTKINVDTFYNPALGANIPRYNFELKRKPIVFFKNDNFLRTGINGEFYNFKFLEPDSLITFKLGGTLFSLRAYGEIQDNGDFKIIDDYRLVLDWSENKAKMEVEILKVDKASITSADFIEAPKIIWVGDLNNDDIPDLILEESTHSGYIKRGFYLSSDLKGNNYPRTILIEGSFD